MKKTHLVHVCNYFYPEVGGEAKYIYQLAKKQVESGLRVSVVTRNNEGFFKFEIIDGIEVHRVGGSRKKIFRFLTSILLMKRKIKEIKADIYHAHDWNNTMICKLVGKKFITTVHGYGFLDEFKLTKGIISFILSKAEYLAVNHKFLMKKYKKYNPIYICAGIDLKKYPYKKIKRNNTFLVVSHLYPPRRVGIYIKGFKILNDKKMKMIIAGDGVERQELEESAKGYNIEFLGFRSDVPNLISNSMMVCGGGLTAMESMAIGRPCIVAKGQDTEVVSKAEIINTPEEFVEKAKFIIKNLNSLSKKVNIIAKKEYSIDSVASKYLEIYKKVK